MELSSINERRPMDALLSDEVVLQWLVGLESEHAEAQDAVEAEEPGRH